MIYLCEVRAKWYKYIWQQMNHASLNEVQWVEMLPSLAINACMLLLIDKKGHLFIKN